MLNPDGSPAAKKSMPIVLIVAASIGAAVGTGVVTGLVNSDSMVERQLAGMAVALNRTMPRVIDSETRADISTAGPGKQFVYKYTLVNIAKDELDLRKFVDAMRLTLINQYKTTPSMKTLRDWGVTLHYQYSDKTGVLLTDIPVTPDDIK